MALSTIASWAGSVVSTIADCAGSSIVENLVSTAYSYLLDHMLPADSEAELNRLQTALPQITAVMGIAEALKKKHPNAGQWVEQFRQALEASEDVLDELEYKKLEAMVINQDEVGGSAFCSKKRKVSALNDDTLRRLKEAVTMLDRAVDGVKPLLQVATVLGIRDLSESRHEAGKILRRETTSFLAEREVFGREVENGKIIGWLKRPTHARLSSFGIVGVGGVGKTTIAQFAYQEMRGSNHFDKTIWVCVSINFSVEDITTKMLGELGETSCSGKPLNALQEVLNEKINLKKIFLVLDDIWDDEKRSDWEQLLAPLRCVQEGSKILFTTRMKSVADLLASVINTKRQSLALQGLGEQELRLLFYSYAFNGFSPDDHRYLKTFGDQILKMLRGNPLAAKVIGSLLNSHMDNRHWRNIMNHSSIFNIGLAKDVVEVLKLSYYHLPADVQVCFRFCSIFPQDYLFDKNDLIKMWIASGFIRQQLNQEKRPEDIGEDYFNLLLRKSFFEYSHSYQGEKYVMHDLMHELAENVSNGECCRVKPNESSVTIPGTVRHVSVHESEIDRVRHLENLRSLIIFPIANMNSFVLPNNLIKKSLRLLKINKIHIMELPEEISYLVHLRYLSIGLNYVSQRFKYSLPASICKLYHLQVLEFSIAGDNLSYSVETTGMTNLRRLRYIRLPVDTIQTIRGIHKLTSLQELTFFIGHEIGSCINELSTLNNLRRLSIKKIENIGDPSEAKSANLLDKDNLMSLFLAWTSKSSPDNPPDNPEQIIDYLQPHPNLMELKIGNYKGKRSPSWMEESPLLNLSFLKLFNCPIWKNQLFSWQMPYLKILNIYDCPNLDKLPNMPLTLIEFRVYNVGLTSLPNLYQNYGNNTPQPLSLKSSLRVVEIQRCPNLIKLNGFLQQGNLDLQGIVELTINECERLEHLPTHGFGNLKSMINLTLRNSPKLVMDFQGCLLPAKLKSLDVGNCGELDVPLLEASSDLTTLTDLQISTYANITSITASQNSFRSLESLNIFGCMMLVEISFMEEAHGINQEKNFNILHMDIRNCPNLARLPSMPLSVIVFALDNVGLSVLPQYYQSSDPSGGPLTSLLEPSLTIVRISNCQKLTSLNGFLQQNEIDFQAIGKIEVGNCRNLEYLPVGAFGKFVSLKELTIRDCPMLVAVDNESNLLPMKLKSLNIGNCGKLDVPLLKASSGLTTLTEMDITNCESLIKFPNLLPLSLITFLINDVGTCALPQYYQSSNSSSAPSTLSPKPSLRIVRIINCQNLESLDGFLQQDNIYFQWIEQVEISNCKNLVYIPVDAFGKFVSLKFLTIRDCPKLKAVNNKSNLLPVKLESLDMGNCSELDVPLLELASHLTTLTDLWIDNCANISCIPSSENAFESLSSLSINHCDKLVEHLSKNQAHDVYHGSNLAFLKLSYLEIDHLSLLLIEPLRSLRYVSYLRVWNCSAMEALPEKWFLQNCSNLRSLVIHDASSLKSLPGTMARLTSLKYLEIRKAELLKKLELPVLPASLKEKYIEGHGWLVASGFE